MIQGLLPAPVPDVVSRNARIPGNVALMIDITVIVRDQGTTTEIINPGVPISDVDVRNRDAGLWASHLREGLITARTVGLISLLTARSIVSVTKLVNASPRNIRKDLCLHLDLRSAIRRRDLARLHITKARIVRATTLIINAGS